mmetsp:Transcript_50717/g.115195  ORF Transcript_50717/g.115195 Transcript_50717/m.115195 type:complete len:272 (+) Transcript_50717:88-903(+)
MASTERKAVLVLGGTGNTGRPLAQQLLLRGFAVRMIVRSPQKLPPELATNPSATIIEGAVLDLSDQELERHVAGCVAIVSCLGHVISCAGMFGPPRRLVTQAIKRVTEAAIRARVSSGEVGRPVKVILMSTVGVSDPTSAQDRAVRNTCGQHCVFACLRCCLPPHADNEDAAVALRGVAQVGPHGSVEWCAVRPDDLISGDLSEYTIQPDLSTSLFDADSTTRENVAHFMCELIENDECWGKWKGRMPVVLNRPKQVDSSAESGNPPMSRS